MNCQLKLQKDNSQTNIKVVSVDVPISNSVQTITLDSGEITSDTERIVIQFNLNNSNIDDYLFISNPQLKPL